MNWKTIRLELARTEGFPKGSPSRAFLLRLPLDENGMIDADAVERRPEQAVVRRFWSSEPDQSGHIQRSNGSWLFRCSRPKVGETIFRLAAAPLQVDGQITVEDAEGRQLPFRVASIRGPGFPGAKA